MLEAQVNREAQVGIIVLDISLVDNSVFKKYENIQSLDRKAVVTLIEQIIVYSKEQIEIQFKYSDEMQEMIEAVQIIRERQERKGEFVCGA